MPKHWLFDREDPRTVLLATVVILLWGGFVVSRMIGDGGFGFFFATGWLVLSVGQVIWAAVRYRRWRLGRRQPVGRTDETGH